MVGAFFVLLVLWLFISQWLRVTVFVSAMIVWLAVSPLLLSLYPMARRSAHHGRRHDRTGQYRGQRRRWRRVQPRQQRYSAADRAADLSQPDQLAERFLCRRAEAQDAVPGPAAARMRSRLTCW
ncbi:cellulose biosynthesis protein BcsG [Klebsiella pneumoniae]